MTSILKTDQHVMRRDRRETILLWILGIAGAVFSVVVFFTILPSSHIQAEVDQDQARAIAVDFLDKMGVSGLDAMGNLDYMETQPAVFLYLDDVSDDWEEVESGLEELPYGRWTFNWEEGGLLGRAGSSYQVEVSFTGRILSYSHGLGGSKDESVPEEETVLRFAGETLSAAGFDETEWQLTDHSSNPAGESTRTQLTFVSVRESLAPTRLTMTLTGATVAGFELAPGIPDHYEQTIERRNMLMSLVRGLPNSVGSFVLMVLLAIIFLRRYHEGEVGIRGGAFVFVLFLALSTPTIYGMLPMISRNVGIPMFNIVQKQLFMGVIMFAFFVFGGSLLVFIGYCIGESYAREGWSRSLQAVDSLMGKRLFTRSFARSVHDGYLAGAVLLGLTSLAHVISYQVAGYRLPHHFMTWSYRWPFLMIVFGSVVSALFLESVIRFPFLAFGRRLFRGRPVLGLALGSVFSACLFIVFGDAPTPDPFWLMILFLFSIGLVSCLIFIRYGFLASFWSTVVFTTVLQVGPMLTSGLASLETAAVAASVVLLLPIVLALLGSRIRQDEAEHIELMPPHIRRITERERLQKEMEIAKTVQMKLLPKQSPSLPGYDLAGICIPAAEVGGDYFDFIDLRDGQLGIAVGDVSGKGVSAAIYMTLTKGILQSHVGFESSPVSVLNRVNSLMYRTIEKGIFVSLFYAVLDANKRKLVFSRAGHNPGILLKPGSRQFESLHPPGMALGLDEGDIFTSVLEENVMDLTPGDVLVFYTDGITEAMNIREEEYGEQRLQDCIARSSNMTSRRIVEQITGDVRRFSGEQPQHDDITLVVMKVLP